MLNNKSENRACGCNNGSYTFGCNSTANLMKYDCNYQPEGINASFGYNTEKEEDNLNCDCACNKQACCNERQETREKMMLEIRSLDFAIIELGLYLDTHPDDEKALCLYKEYARKVKDLKDAYQKIYGPLTIYYPCNKWRWLEEPWPWERGNC